MTADSPARRVRVYEWGEAHDDLRVAFVIDESAYADTRELDAVLTKATSTMRTLGVIFSVEIQDGPPVPGWPTWEDFWQRYIVEGVDMPVRPPPLKRVPPPSWQEMWRALDSDHAQFRDYLTALLHDVFPERPLEIALDYGPLRRSAGSIDWSEEKYGFEVFLNCRTGLLPEEAAERFRAAVTAHGWKAEPGNDSTIVDVKRNHYRLWLSAEEGHAALQGYSPLYRAPKEADAYVMEPRVT